TDAGINCSGSERTNCSTPWGAGRYPCGYEGAVMGRKTAPKKDVAKIPTTVPVVSPSEAERIAILNTTVSQLREERDRSVQLGHDMTLTIRTLSQRLEAALHALSQTTTDLEARASANRRMLEEQRRKY